MALMFQERAQNINLAYARASRYGRFVARLATQASGYDPDASGSGSPITTLWTVDNGPGVFVLAVVVLLYGS